MFSQQPVDSVRKLSEREKAAHLLNRAGFGPLPGDVDRVLKIGLRAYVESQLHPDKITDRDMARWEPDFAMLKAGGKEVRRLHRDDPQVILNHLLAYRLMQAVHSRRQLHEAMVDFWFNHFNVYWRKDEVRFLTPGYEHDAIRPRTFGKFGELLLAVAKHPAMLVYLDNALSTSPNVPRRFLASAPGINENYARELMELHTMGVDGGYTQKDVEEVARCFTGWTFDSDELTFKYDDAMHDPGDKVVLGTRITSSGYDEGAAVLRLLVEHPSTARFIATKLVRRFVADDPPKPLVDRVAAVFTKTNGDIREMCRAILTSDEFFEPAAYRAKVKSPFELVVSSVRAIGATVLVPRNDALTAALRVIMAPNEQMMKAADEQRMKAFDEKQRRAGLLRGLPAEFHAYMHLVEAMQGMGQLLYEYVEPTGYPDRGDFWMNAITSLNRMTFAISLAENRIAGMEFGRPELIRLNSSITVKGQPSWERVFGVVTGVPGGRVVHSHKTVVPAEFARTPERIVALALGSPDFQYK